jgi:hypothetical protein
MIRPQPIHKERAARAYRIATVLCLWRCIVHNHDDDTDPPPRLVEALLPDIIGALLRMLQMQLGQPVNIAVPTTADDACVLAKEVAAGANYDASMFGKATRLAEARIHLHKAQQVFKREDSPDWGR